MVRVTEVSASYIDSWRKEVNTTIQGWEAKVWKVKDILNGADHWGYAEDRFSSFYSMITFEKNGDDKD